MMTLINRISELAKEHGYEVTAFNKSDNYMGHVSVNVELGLIHEDGEPEDG